MTRNYFAGDGQTHLGREGVREEVDAKDFSASIKNDTGLASYIMLIFLYMYILDDNCDPWTKIH